MGDLRYTTIGVANNVVVDARPEIPRSLGNDGWKILLQQTAPNALHDSKARYDRPKCDKDTRVEVIREMTDWIKDRESSQRLLCMTGAAGSGKSALLQTMAEICSKANILGSAYFFGAADPSRNNTSSLIPTIAYQLGRKNTHLRQYIGVAVEEDELIFSKTLLEQMNALIRDPVRRLHDAETLDLPSFRYVLLIDGLDECQGEDNQVEILTAIKECLLDNDFPLPFRILIASRPEWAIRSALEPNGELNGLAYHIQLSDQYDATGDIRRYLRRRLHQLGLRSCDPRARSSWFTEEDIEQLVIAASGQFIYAATVVRYLSEHRGSLVDRLKIVLTWTPADGQSARPFKPLDLLYSGILSAAKLAYEAVDTHSSRDFLLLFRAYHINATRGFAQIPSNKTSQLSNEELDYYLQLESGAHQAVVSDLWSLVAIRRRRSSSSALHIYHKSFSDFLNEPTRSKELFVPESRVHGHLAKCFMESIIRNPQTVSWSLKDYRDVNWHCLSRSRTGFYRVEKAMYVASGDAPLDTPSMSQVAAASQPPATSASQQTHKPSHFRGRGAVDATNRAAMQSGRLDDTRVAGMPSSGASQTYGPQPVTTHYLNSSEQRPETSARAGQYPETYHHMPAQGPTMGGSTFSSFFSNPHHFRMRDFCHTSIGTVENVTLNAGAGLSHASDGWSTLERAAAPNALHDSNARFDPPKCEEDTRVEVINELKNWIEDRESPQRLLCMTGAAGSGKSALQQTMAEICSKSNILGSAYFFGAADATRNTPSSLVPTIAYQLGLANPAVREQINFAVQGDSHIFSRSLESQMKTLICDPVRRLRAAGMLDYASFRYAILIDGLDECKGEDNQAGILKAIKKCLLDVDLPFRIFLASRPEWAIRSAMQPGGELSGLVYHIALSDQYDATADIRLYLRRRIEALGLRSSDPRAHFPGWFTQENIEQLVAAASGQFVYAATVVRYMSERRSSPVERLRIILGWTPADSTRPFEPLDLLYSGILSVAKAAYEAVDTHRDRDFLLLFSVYYQNSVCGFGDRDLNQVFCVSNEELNGILQVESGAHENIISDLRSLVTLHRESHVEKPGTYLRPYHKTFSDFLWERHRSGNLYVPESRVPAHLAKCFLRNVVRSPSWGWKILLKHTAPNALYDSEARYDPPKCDEDTRVEVLREITDWIKDRGATQKVLCMTGAAGAGKSALQQTTAETCSKSNTLGSGYFFGAADSTRNHTGTLVPTIAYQLGQHNPGLKRFIGSAVEEDELIFSKSLVSQINVLISEPVRRLREAGNLDLASFRYVVLIDGLDECQGEHNQARILTAIKKCLLDDDLPFRIFITSRPEWAIRSALQPGGELHELAYHIQLSDQYDATADIRRYLWRNLTELGHQSSDPRARSPGWFTQEDIEELVKAASGQFIYVATVVRYLSEHRSSPVDRLKIVLTWTPDNLPLADPFKQLDALYRGILSTAKIAYEAVDTNGGRDFLLLFRAYHLNATRGFTAPDSFHPYHFPIDVLNGHLKLDSGAHEAVISDLQSLVSLVPINPLQSSRTQLRIYHQSFSDFLNEQARSKDLFVPESRVHAYLAKCFLQTVIQRPADSSTVPLLQSNAFKEWSQFEFTGKRLLGSDLLPAPWFAR
ncbi:hypothetical protein MD484_g4894, partial [Candolleomyces efflorescens]